MRTGHYVGQIKTASQSVWARSRLSREAVKADKSIREVNHTEGVLNGMMGPVTFRRLTTARGKNEREVYRASLTLSGAFESKEKCLREGVIERRRGRGSDE